MVWLLLLLLHGCISSFSFHMPGGCILLVCCAHSTGHLQLGMQASLYPHIREKLEGIVLTSPALRVKPAHPIVGAVAPIFSLVATPN